MNKKSLTILLIVLGILLTLFSPLIMGVLAIPTWIYLVLKIRKNDTLIFQDKVEPALAERLRKKMKVFLIVAGCVFIVFIVGAFMHRDSHGLMEFEGTPVFIITLASLWLFIFSTAGSLFLFLKGQQKIA